MHGAYMSVNTLVVFFVSQVAFSHCPRIFENIIDLWIADFSKTQLLFNPWLKVCALGSRCKQSM